VCRQRSGVMVPPQSAGTTCQETTDKALIFADADGKLDYLPASIPAGVMGPFREINGVASCKSQTQQAVISSSLTGCCARSEVAARHDYPERGDGVWCNATCTNRLRPVGYSGKRDYFAHAAGVLKNASLS
jgi:hypothetical protein